MGLYMDKKIKDKNSSTRWIRIFGAREHNLKNIDVQIPKDQLTVITGPSGSGKSTLALDVLFTEGQRRYVESLSAYARQFLGVSKKPDFDRIEGLCPAVAIEQKTVGSNPRSTVGTITEIYDYLRVLFARIGHVHCPRCESRIAAVSADQIVAMVQKQFNGNTVTIAAPIVQERKGEFTADLKRLWSQGWSRFTIDGMPYRFRTEEDINQLKLKKTFTHSIDVHVDIIELRSSEQARLHEAIERALQMAGGRCKVIAGVDEFWYSSERICIRCAESAPELEPRLFSFNSPIGACQQCNGLGIIHEWPWGDDDPEAWKARYPQFFGSYAQELVCSACHGQRLNPTALAVLVGGKNIYQIGQLSIRDALTFFEKINLDEQERTIAAGLLREIVNRFSFLQDVGLGYLSLNRTARTLSGGEGQRIRLATQIGSALSGVMYVLDEPSIGLHQRDNDRLIETLKKLRDLGNTVVVVEHDIETMQQADYLIDMGPAAGILGGTVIASGTPRECADNPASVTGAFIAGTRSLKVPEKYRTPRGFLTLKNAKKHNLQNLTVQFPLGVLCGVSGVSGSGKSSLVMHELVPALQRALTTHGAQVDDVLEGYENLENLVVIDQSPIGRTPRSNPATYLGIFDAIRSLYASLPESNARGYKVGRFSFNVPEGRCATCRGEGTIKVSMHFLPDVTMTCKDCQGSRYSKEVLAITYKGKNIADVLEMTALEAHVFFAAHAQIAKRLKLMCDVGLDYVKLGQPATTLSGGEAQRIKLVDELAKRGNKTLYVLDEPTTGLHNCDIEKLLVVLNTLVDKGNSMLVIEHNLDVLKTADYLIDLGPEGGDGGGNIVASGTPNEVAACPASHTGRYLKQLIKP